MKRRKISVNDFQNCTSLEFVPPEGIKILPKISRLEDYSVRMAILNGGQTFGK